MGLFMDLLQGLDSLGHPLEPQVWLNLYTISREDGNFGESPPPGDHTVTQVEYKGAGPRRRRPPDYTSLQTRTSISQLSSQGWPVESIRTPVWTLRGTDSLT